jgi:hypothetical protein
MAVERELNELSIPFNEVGLRYVTLEQDLNKEVQASFEQRG